MLTRPWRGLDATNQGEVKLVFSDHFLVFYSTDRLPSEDPPYKIEDFGGAPLRGVAAGASFDSTRLTATLSRGGSQSLRENRRATSLGKHRKY